MEISIMNISDYEDVHKLWKNTEGMGLRSLDDSKDGIRTFLNRNPNTSFVCRENSRVVGVILCGHDGRRGYIYHAAVDYRYRKKGIGKALVEKAISALESEGIKKAALVVFACKYTCERDIMYMKRGVLYASTKVGFKRCFRSYDISIRTR